MKAGPLKRRHQGQGHGTMAKKGQEGIVKKMVRVDWKKWGLREKRGGRGKELGLSRCPCNTSSQQF